ncbi:MAG: acyltransferase family protein [Bacteroidia bacterium]
MKIQAEIPVLDSLRAIAAWSVCLYHFVCMTVGFVDPQGWVYDVFYFGRYGVQMFFVISGLVIPWALYKNSYHLKNFFSFIGKRFIRVEPPYLFSLALAIAFILLRKFSPTFHGEQRPVTAEQVLLHIGYLVPFVKGAVWFNSVYWTLAIEFQYYLSVAFIYFLIISRVFFIRLIAYAIIFSGPLVIPREDLLPYWLPVFGLGMMIFLYKTERIRMTETVVLSLLFTGIIYYSNGRDQAIVSVLSEVAILGLFSFSNRILTFLGRFSYSVYLIHAVVGGAMVNVLSHYASGSFSKFVLVLGAVVVTGISGYIMYRCIERPAKNLSSRIKYKPR